ncbi:MAG: hypothetical protein IJR89_07760 [Clostridia bacterium]|nr:hypothetical protein [Clostridia bacterium]
MCKNKQNKSGAIKTVLLIIGALTVVCGIIAAIKALEPKIKSLFSCCRMEDDEEKEKDEDGTGAAEALEDAAEKIAEEAKDAAEAIGDAAEDLVKND